MMSLLIAAGSAFAVPPVADTELADMRGGFRLPSGIDVALAVETRTAVDGAIVLKSVFTVADGAPSFRAFAPAPGTTVSLLQRAASAQGAATPTITFDARGMPTVTAGVPLAAISISAGRSAAVDTAGLATVDSGSVTDAGTIALDRQSPLQTARLDGPDLSVVHFAGSAFGGLVANTANDRAIDTATTISIDLRNAGPDVLGSTMFRVERVALDALATRGL